MKEIRKEFKIDPSIERLFDCIQSEGGVQRVSEKIDRSSVSMYNYRNKGVEPNFSIIRLLASNFINWDFNFIIRGESLEDAEKSQIKEELVKVKQENESLRLELDLFKETLRREYAKVKNS